MSGALNEEKQQYATDVVHAEQSDDNFSDKFATEAAQLIEPDPDSLKRALRKLDFIFLPSVTLIYFLSFLDRANIGNAKAAGLMEDLKLTNHQYSIALTVTYVPYIAAELPLTLLIRKV